MKPDGMVSEITIQFAGETLSGSLLNKIQFRSVRRMLELGRNGISFSVATILKVRSLLHSLANETKGFYMMTTFLNLLYELSLDPEMEVLSGKSVERVEMKGTSKRISQVCDYIEQHEQDHLRDLFLDRIQQHLQLQPAVQEIQGTFPEGFP